MKPADRQSTNFEDRTRDTASAAPHRNPETSPALQRVQHAREAEYDKWGTQRIKATLKDKDSPFRPMLNAMKPDPAPMKRKRGEDPSIPIPTPRPDPSKPYVPPKVTFGYDNTGEGTKK